MLRRSRSKVCRLKAEKVVNPPHSPTITNSRRSSETAYRSPCSVSVLKYPITRHPSTLIKIVPYGN